MFIQNWEKWKDSKAWQSGRMKRLRKNTHREIEQKYKNESEIRLHATTKNDDTELERNNNSATEWKSQCTYLKKIPIYCTQ